MPVAFFFSQHFVLLAHRANIYCSFSEECASFQTSKGQMQIEFGALASAQYSAFVYRNFDMHITGKF